MYKLVSFNLCPYVQRTAVVLNEKNIPYEIIYIDLSNKPDWFLALSPTGRVPLLQTEAGDVLFESAVINEYLDEVHPPRLLAGGPLERAYDRMWRDFASTLYGPIYRLYSVGTEAMATRPLNRFRTILPRFEAEVKGPYFRGERFGMVDVAIASVLMRLAWIERLAPHVTPLAEFPKVRAWRDAVLARPSVRQSVLPNIYDLFVESLYENGSWLVPEDVPPPEHDGADA